MTSRSCCPSSADGPLLVAIRFGRFELRPESRQLLADGKPAALGARAFDLLHALIERRERVVSKNELLDVVWPGLVVEENNLQVQISALRKLLGPQAIATIPGRGYRFSAALDSAVDGIANTGAPSPTPPAAKRFDAPVTSLGNLPTEFPPLYGRDAELTMLRSLIEAQKLVTVVGAGGIGKSRLAQATAHSLTVRWADGAWMVELAGLSDPMLLSNAVAQALRITLPGQGVALDELVTVLAQRHLLLVLDNCEHLLDAVAALVEAVLRSAQNVTVLATSQEPLRLPAEQQYRLVPLAVPSANESGARAFGALALFEARARAVEPRFVLNDDSMVFAIDICRRLDGLPLAIELAAARVATLGLRSVRDKLDERFKLLTAGSRSTLRRHQTLRAALEWSHKLLNDAERAVFRRLGVFAGGFTMELAQRVAGDAQLDEWAVLDHLSALIDKSLVVAEAGDAPRYRLLESARAFALEQLAAAEETSAVVKRHALAMLGFLERIDDANLDGELRTDQFAARVLPELDNLRAAHAWATGEGADVQVAIGLAAHAGSLIDYAVECADWLLPLQAAVESGAVEPALTARYWRAIGAANMAPRVPFALQLKASSRALSLYRPLGQPRRVVPNLIRLAWLADAGGDAAAAQRALDEARALVQPEWPPEFRILVLRREGFVARGNGRLTEALALHRDCVRVSASSGDWRLEVMARNNLVDLLWQTGPIEEAAHEASELAAELAVRPAADAELALIHACVMGILSELGSIEEASAAGSRGLPAMRRCRRYYVEEWVYLFWRRGQLDAATLMLGVMDAKLGFADTLRPPNEERLIAHARAGLETALPADVLASHLAAGAALTEDAMYALICETLSKPSRNKT